MDLTKQVENKRQPLFPRIRGRAFEDGSQWAWEIHVTFLADREAGDGATELQEPITVTSGKDRFPTKDAALADMKSHVPSINEIVLQSLGGSGDEGFIDLKAGGVHKNSF